MTNCLIFYSRKVGEVWMKIDLLDVAGFQPAILAMRNPMDSWSKSDSAENVVGEKDKELSLKLQKAGTEHCKHLRMIVVWADISAPRYWWQEFDTYRAGVEKVSCSTMHRMMARELTNEDFEMCNGELYGTPMLEMLNYLNGMIAEYKAEDNPVKKRFIWEFVIQMLPQSYIQKRTVMMSYAALRSIYRQRDGHKLKEWKQFRDWIEGLPESWMITEG